VNELKEIFKPYKAMLVVSASPSRILMLELTLQGSYPPRSWTICLMPDQILLFLQFMWFAPPGAEEYEAEQPNIQEGIQNQGAEAQGVEDQGADTAVPDNNNDENGGIENDEGENVDHENDSDENEDFWKRMTRQSSPMKRLKGHDRSNRSNRNEGLNISLPVKVKNTVGER